LPYLVKRVKQLRNQGTSLAGHSQHTLEAKLVEVANETVCRGAEGKRVSPEIPLEGNDRGREHAGPDKGEGGLSSSKTGVEKSEARYHDHDHGRGHEDVGLITRLVPLVEVFGDCKMSMLVCLILNFAARSSHVARATSIGHGTCVVGCCVHGSFALTRITTSDVVSAIENGRRADP